MSDSNEVPAHLRLYHDRDYFVGEQGRTCSGYQNYENCAGVLNTYSSMLDRYFEPRSVLDVGAAYGFVVQWFRSRAVPAYGVEPSPFAREQVHPLVQGAVFEGSLPELPTSYYMQGDTNTQAIFSRLELVTCTEVLEHLPEELVPASLKALTDRSRRYVICLIMLEGPGADGDEGHICLKSRAWWEEQFDATGFVKDEAAEAWFNDHEFSRHMLWTGRFFVRRKPTVKL